MNRYKLTMLGLMGLTVALVFVIQNNWQQRINLSRQLYIEANQSVATREVARLESAVRSIYENIRTLSLLPSVRAIDRHGTNLSDEGRQAFIQIYNNLSGSVDVSEVYVVPIDLDPHKIDPVTQKLEEPILMFDQLITGDDIPDGSGEGAARGFGLPPRNKTMPQAQLPVVETYEYQLMANQAAWLKSKYPTTRNITALDVPFVSGPEIITCDNRRYNSTANDADRSGLVFSVPFYGADGKIRGMISAIILSNALKQFLPSQNMALVNPGNGYVNSSDGVKSLATSADYVAKAEVDPHLIYSQVIPFQVKDSRSPWFVWAGQPDSMFYSSRDLLSSNSIRFTGLMILMFWVLAVGICITLLHRNAAQAHALAISLRKERDTAEKSEAEAQATSEAFQLLNNDVSRLNGELAERLRQLSEAQEDIVKKGKLGQLGNLVATVAHELRNPLGSVRTTVFMLQRKLKASPIDVSSQLQRIEQGILRCDMIITQLLDYSRSQPANTANVDVVEWLQNVLQEEAARLPSQVTLRYVVAQNNIVAAIDPERMRRGVINLVSNAAEALTHAESAPKIIGDPTITVSLREIHNRIEITVNDNGPGIAPEVLNKVGEPLFTTKSFGTGLGVAAVRKVAELHGGGLNVKSIVGFGASFTIWVPLNLSAEKLA